MAVAIWILTIAFINTAIFFRDTHPSRAAINRLAIRTITIGTRRAIVISDTWWWLTFAGNRVTNEARAAITFIFIVAALMRTVAMAGIDTLDTFLFASVPVTFFTGRWFTAVLGANFTWRASIFQTRDTIALAIHIRLRWRTFAVTTYTLFAIGTWMLVVALITDVSILVASLPIFAFGYADSVSAIAATIRAIFRPFAWANTHTNWVTIRAFIQASIGYPKTAFITIIWDGDIDDLAIVLFAHNGSASGGIPLDFRFGTAGTAKHIFLDIDGVFLVTHYRTIPFLFELDTITLPLLSVTYFLASLF